MDGFYNGTQGSVPTSTSVNRLTPRLDKVMDALHDHGTSGMTWREVATALSLHHGQASGALSNLHRLGKVFVLKGLQREKCQVYVHSDYRTYFEDFECVDTPVRTRSKQMVEALIEAAEAVIDSGGAPLTVFTLEQVLNTYREEIK